MDIFFEVWLNLKNDYYLTRWVKIALDHGIEIRIYSDDELIIREHFEEVSELDYCYLIAALHLVQWAQRTDFHASRTTKNKSWLDKLKEKLGDEVDNAAEGWELLSVHEVKE